MGCCIYFHAQNFFEKKKGQTSKKKNREQIPLVAAAGLNVIHPGRLAFLFVLELVIEKNNVYVCVCV